MGTTPLFKKLGIKDGHKLSLLNPPLTFVNYIESLDIRFNYSKDGLHQKSDILIWFVNLKIDLTKVLPTLVSKIERNGMIWVCWYKKSSGKQLELNEDFIRQTALADVLVDVKVCSIDDQWSALKLVIRKALR